MTEEPPARSILDRLGLIVAELMVCILAVVVTISFTAIIFSGPLAPLLGRGVGLGLGSAVILCSILALTASYRGTVAHPQDVTAVILGLSAAGIAGTEIGTDPERLYATVVMLIATASLGMGLVFLLAGTIRLGHLARFIPFPVLCGFLASTGYLITRGSLGMVSGADTLAGLATPEAAWRWAPAVAIGLATLIVVRRTGNGLLIPAIMLATLAGFYGWLGASGLSLQEAGARGMLLGPFAEGAGLAASFDPSVISRADYGAILRETPAIVTLIGLGLMGAILNISGLELATGKSIDANRDLRRIGIANIATAGIGGPPGYHILSETLLGRRLTRGSSRWIGAGVALACALVLMLGPSVLAALPVVVFASVLIFMGLDVLLERLWLAPRRMPPQDAAIVALIFGTAATVGFLQAIAVGVLAAAAMFVVAYSRLDLVRTSANAALRRSTTERPEAAARLLAARGGETLIFELQGYVFFGTAHALTTRLGAAIANPGAGVRQVILDCRRVQGLDVSAIHGFGRLEALFRARGVRLILTGLGPALRDRLARAGVLDRLRTFPTLDAALTAVEDELLAEQAGDAAHPAAQAPVARLLARAEAMGAAVPPPEAVAAGAEVLRQGEPADALVLIEDGLLSARVAGADGHMTTVARFQPGTVVGEIALYAGGQRTATVVADVESRIRRVTRDDLAEISAHDPDFARDMHAAIAALLARRLARTTGLVHELSR